MKFNYFLLLCLAVLISCNEEITVGSSLLEEGSISLEYNDSIAVTGYTRMANPQVVYRGVNTTQSTYLLGQIDDPVFGRSNTELYLSTALFDDAFPSFDTLKIDSVIMSLPLDTLGQYANDNAIHNIRVYQLSNELTTDIDTIKSDEQFASEMTALADVNMRISHRDSVKYYNPTSDTIVKDVPQLRIPLDTMLWHDLAQDTSINRDPEMYSSFIKGFKLVSNPETDAIAGIDLGSDQRVYIELYFSPVNNDTTHYVYLFDLGGVRGNFLNHDISATELESALNDTETEYWYIQGMQGPEIVVDISEIDNYTDQVINRAILELPLLHEADPVVDPLSRMRVLYIDEDGNRQRILDNLIFDNGGLLIDVFGGSLDSLEVNGTTRYFYQMEITNHINSIVGETVTSRELIIECSNKPSTAQRSVIYSAKNPDYPARIKLVTSNP